MTGEVSYLETSLTNNNRDIVEVRPQGIDYESEEYTWKERLEGR